MDIVLNHHAKIEKAKNLKTLRITCLMSSAFSPLITFLWIRIYPDLNADILTCVLFSVLFLLVYLLSYTSRIVRENTIFTLYLICFISSASCVFLAYTHNFAQPYILLLIFLMFGVILVQTKIKHMLIYVTTMLSVIFMLIYITDNPELNKWSAVTMFIMFSILGYIHLKSTFNIQLALLENEAHYKILVETSPQAIIIHQEGKLLYANPAALRLTETRAVDDLSSLNIFDFIHPDYLQICRERIDKAIQGHKLDFKEIVLKTSSGRNIEVESNILRIYSQGKPAILNIFIDITRYKETERKLRDAHSRYQTLVEYALVGVYMYQNGKLTYINPYMKKILGYSREEILSMDYNKFLHPDDRHKLNEYTIMKNEKVPENAPQIRIIRKDGSIAYVETHASKFIYKDSPALIGTVLDITHLKKAEEKIKQVAYYDELTGLPNRYMLNKRSKRIIRSISDSNILGVMFIDLDKFKIVNDTLGHTIGDHLLREVSKRLKHCVGEADIVARYGGDEFVIISVNKSKNEIELIVKNILAELHHPFNIDNHELFCTPSIGISFYPEDGDTLGLLIKNADIAMYYAKESGRNNYKLFDSSYNDAIAKKMNLSNSLRKAVNNEEFMLYYQPQIDFATGKVCGIEALIRWQHPQLGMISPAEFIPLAEETGLIVPIGEWVIEAACMQNKSLQASGLSHVSVAVNVSANQLAQANFVDKVQQALDKSSLSAECLVIEITESVMQDINTSTRVIEKLKALGVKVAIDDFGTGYSSFSLIKNLPIDILKIDPSFISDIDANPSTLTLIRMIIEMGIELDFKIVVEGIETEHQASILKQNNCSYGQGYYYSRPVPANDIEEILKGY